MIQEVLKRSPLIEAQIELGASVGDFLGCEAALSFGDPVEEQKRVRESVGLFDLSCHGVMRVGGSEGAQFLQGLVTNDVKALPDGKGLRAAFLTGHGKVRAFCRILRAGDEYLIINDPQTHEKIWKYVFPFSYAGDFKVEDASDSFRTLSVQGPLSPLVLKEVCFEPVPALEEHDWVETVIAGHHVLVVGASHTGEPGFDILIPASGLRDVWDFILLKGAFHCIKPVGCRALDSLRIEAGIPLWGIDIDESNMMLESALADAVSFTKGCFTGQEAVAMATYRGHVSKKLSGLVLTGDTLPARGDIVSKEGKEVGHITSVTRSTTLEKVIALALIKYGFFDPGTSLDVQSHNQMIPAQVVELPFYKRN
jgi:glycine cleavage system T protein